MNVEIFSENPEKGIEYLERIFGNMKYKDVKSLTIYPKHMTKKAVGVLTNGDVYTVLPCSETIRGHKWNNALVSRKVSLEFINERIATGLYVGEHGEYGDITFFDE